MTSGPAPLRTPDEAAAYAISMLGRGVYRLGSGDILSSGDDPRDCSGFAICECFGIRRRRPGFNRGPWSSVADDINTTSVWEDAKHRYELFVVAPDAPRPGDLLMYPGLHGEPGHCKMVVGFSTSWWDAPTVECHGPNGHTPGITSGTGATMGRRSDTLLLRLRKAQ